jgi:hypothetical protein
MNSAVFGAFSAFGNDTEAYGNIRGVGTKMGTLVFVLCHERPDLAVLPPSGPKLRT